MEISIMAIVTVSGYAAQQPKRFNDNTSIRVGEKVYDNKTKERVTQWWDVVVYDPKGKVHEVLSDTSKSRFVSAVGDLKAKVFNEEAQLTCWTFRSGFTMNVTDKGPGSNAPPKAKPPAQFKVPTAEDDDVPF